MDLIEEIGENFVRYANGIQICFFEIQGQGSGWEMVSLPRPFVDTNYRVFFAFEGSTGTTSVSTRSISANDKTTTSFNQYDVAQLYKAIFVVGKWK